MIPSRRGAVWKQVALGFSLVTLLIAVYWFTFNGYAISGDESFLFDATESLARRGDLRLNFEADNFPPARFQDVQPPEADTEPLQPLLAVVLFRLGELLPGVGLVHSVWVFNVLVTALTAGVLYLFGLTLGYSMRASALTAAAYGLTTVAWPYSRTFFREPLFTLLSLSSVLLMWSLNRRLAAGKRPLWVALAFAGVFVAALFSKEAALLLVPGIIVAALPERLEKLRVTRRAWRVIVLVFALGTVALMVAVNADRLFGVSAGRYAFMHRLEQIEGNLAEASTGVAGYLFSPARSVWLYSPVLLLGFVAWPFLLRRKRLRELLLPLVMLVSFVVGYALIRGSEWYGGTGWGARYLVPVTPFLALWLLPVLERFSVASAPRWGRVGIACVIAWSAAVQVLAILVPVGAYYDKLADQEPPIIPWNEGAWSLRWSPLVVNLDLLGDVTPDLAWQYAGGASWLMPILAVLLVALSIGWLTWWVRREDGRGVQTIITVGTLLVGMVLAIGIGLYAIRSDPRYYGDFNRTHDLLDALDAQLAPDDVIVLNDYTYAEFFMNYYKRNAPVIYTLPQSPGERFSLEQNPAITSPDPARLIHPSDPLVVSYLAQQHDRLWLVIDSSAFIPWSTRPVEWWLSQHYFPLSEVAPSDTARAVSFLMTSAPPSTAAYWPEHSLSVNFGDALELTGFDLGGGMQRHPGDALPVSLLWRAGDVLALDYTVGVLLVDGEGIVVTQHDSMPVNSFAPTSTWRPGAYVRDNHGLVLPETVPAGDYELWAVVYFWQAPEERLPVTGPGGVIGDHALLGTITITG